MCQRPLNDPWPRNPDPRQWAEAHAMQQKSFWWSQRIPSRTFPRPHSSRAVLCCPPISRRGTTQQPPISPTFPIFHTCPELQTSAFSAHSCWRLVHELGGSPVTPTIHLSTGGGNSNSKAVKSFVTHIAWPQPVPLRKPACGVVQCSPPALLVHEELIPSITTLCGTATGSKCVVGPSK